MLYGHLVYFTDIKYILWPIGICYGYLVYFSRFGMLCQEKSGSPVGERETGVRIRPTDQ
jgi:hypothetical protein